MLNQRVVRLDAPYFCPRIIPRKALTMSQHWDEFSKSLAEPVPRRESLRRLGIALTATVLSPLGSEFAWAARRPPDPCKAFCKCRNKRQQNACLDVCKACNKDVSRLAGSCGNYVCCGEGQTPCGDYCADLAFDPYNCGACGNSCAEPGPYEQGTCILGQCEYACVEGAIRCDGTCTFLDWDPNNCGACGNVCAAPGPNEYGWCADGRCEYACYEGTERCNGTCADLNWDPDNCGACGNVCGGSSPNCYLGVCSACTGGLTMCGGNCVDVSYDPANCGGCGNVCGGSTPYCVSGQCTDCEGAGGAICNGVCIDVMWDSGNCGACGNVCPVGTACSFGVCHGVCIDCG